MIPRAVSDTLAHLWKTLDPLRAPMALMGGMAMSAWNYVRSTKDDDLLIGIKNEDQQALLSVLQSNGFRFRQSPPIQPLGELRHLRLVYEPPGEFVELNADLLLVDSEYHFGALARRKSIHVATPDLDIDVLSCEDLVTHKLLAATSLIARTSLNYCAQIKQPWIGDTCENGSFGLV